MCPSNWKGLAMIQQWCEICSSIVRSLGHPAPDNVTCGIKLFVDDVKIYTTIEDTSDTLDFLLQKNLDMVNEWSHK